MTKEDWLHIRDLEEIPLFLFYEYFQEKKDKNRQSITLKEFETYFPQFMTNTIILTKTGVKTVSFESVIHRVYNYYNSIFVEDKIIL